MTINTVAQSKYIKSGIAASTKGKYLPGNGKHILHRYNSCFKNPYLKTNPATRATLNISFAKGSFFGLATKSYASLNIVVLEEIRIASLSGTWRKN